MQLIYIDESGDSSLPTSPTEFFKHSEHFIRVGIGFHDKKWSKINYAIEKFRTQKGLPTDLEIHATDVLYGKKQVTKVINGKKTKDKTLNWFGYKMRTREERRNFLSDYLKAIFNLKCITIFAVVVHKKNIDLTIPQNHIARNPKLKSLELMTERVNYFLCKSTDQKGMLIMDSVNGEDDKLHHDFQRFLYKNSNHIRPYQFVETILFAPSHHSNLLQLADVCTFALKRKVVDSDDSLFNIIEPYFFSVNGGVDGKGIKNWPKVKSAKMQI
jgi:hypothetical protein